jgi:hypothetical protein
MAYSSAEWDKVRAFFEAGLSLAEIVARDEVAIKDRSSISKKAKTEGWKKGGENQQLVEKKVAAVQQVASVKAEIQQKNSTDQQVINTIADERVRIEKFYRDANLLIANTAASKVRQDGKSASYQDLNAAASAIGKTQENVLGKSPDTVINNTVQNATVLPAPDQYRDIAEALLGRV